MQAQSDLGRSANKKLVEGCAKLACSRVELLANPIQAAEDLQAKEGLLLQTHLI